MNDTCTTMRRLLSEQSDRALTNDESTHLRAHLATCPGCRAFERDLRAGLAGIARLPRVSGSSAVREAVIAGVHPGGRSAWPRGWRGWAGQTMKLAGAITAFALVAVILMTVFSGSGSGEPDERFSGAGGQPGTASEPTATPDPAGVATEEDAPQLCVDGQVEFDISIDENPGNLAINSPGFVDITVQAIKSTGGVECRIVTPISLLIEDEAGTRLDVQGNGATALLDATVPSEGAQVSFAWLNWCGTAERVVFDVTMPNWGFGSIHDTPGVSPACDDPDQPSLLGQSSMAEMIPSGACETGEVVLSSSDLQREGDDIYIWVVASNVAECADGERLTVILTDASGAPLDIEGNQIELTLTPDESGKFKWAGTTWSNWCGAPDGANLSVTRADPSSSSWIHVTPACVDDSQPSRLTVTEVAPPDDVWPDNDLGAVMPGLTSEPPVCDPATLELSLTPQPTHGDVIIEVNAGVDSETAPICALDGELSFTISGGDGQPLAVDGNGLMLDTEGGDIMRIVPAPGIAHTIWKNWCGEDGPFTITVTHNGRESTVEVASGPDCSDESQPSLLQPLADAKVSQ